MTFPRNKKVIEGYTTQNGTVVEGLTDNTLRYFKIELRDRSLDHQNKRLLFSALADVIRIKEDCFQEVYSFGALSLSGKEGLLRYFEESGKRVLMVYDSRAIPFVVNEIQTLPVLPDPIRVYVFSDGIYPYKEDFRTVIDKVDLVAMPGAMMNALKYILPQPLDRRIDDTDLSEDEISKMAKEAEQTD